MSWWPISCLILPGLVLLGGRPEASQTLQVITLADLVKEIQKHRGKVVVVDFWAEY